MVLLLYGYGYGFGFGFIRILFLVQFRNLFDKMPKLYIFIKKLKLKGNRRVKILTGVKRGERVGGGNERDEEEEEGEAMRRE